MRKRIMKHVRNSYQRCVPQHDCLALGSRCVRDSNLRIAAELLERGLARHLLLLNLSLRGLGAILDCSRFTSYVQFHRVNAEQTSDTMGWH